LRYHPLEKYRSADFVYAGVAFNGVHALADADLGGEVDDAIDPRKRPADGIGIPNVTLDLLDLPIEFARPSAIRVYLADQTV
jgi:hypothetical protein